MIALGASFAFHEQRDDAACDQARDDAADQRQRHGRRDLAPCQMLGGDRADGDAIDQERGRVVEQALALQNLDHAVRQLHLAQDRDRGGRVRRGHDGAERNRGGPGHVRHQPVRDVGHSGRGQADGGDDQGGDRNPIVAEIAQRGVEGGIEQDRCDKKSQCQVGLQRPGRARRHKRNQRAPDREKGRVGDLDPPRQRR